MGALVGGFVSMYNGRRKTMIVAVFIGLVGIGVTQVNGDNIYVICSGRLIIGISCGFLSISAPRFIEETLTPHLYDQIGPLFNFSMALGIFLSFCVAQIMPNS